MGLLAATSPLLETPPSTAPFIRGRERGSALASVPRTSADDGLAVAREIVDVWRDAPLQGAAPLLRDQGDRLEHPEVRVHRVLRHPQLLGELEGGRVGAGGQVQ